MGNIENTQNMGHLTTLNNSLENKLDSISFEIKL